MKTTIDNLKILYEDNHLIAIQKRPGDISQGDKTGDIPLGDIVKEYIKKRDEKPGNVFLGVIHRIDRPTSGVILFAKTSKGLERMTNEFKARRVEKKYWAIVEGHLKQSKISLRNYLLKNNDRNRSYVVEAERKGAKEAVSHIQVLATGDNYSLVEVHIETGRHHQIRTHLSSLGHPIKGDVKDGARRSNKDLSIDLLAKEVKFEHPVKKEPIRIIAENPINKIWSDLTRGL